MVPILHQTDQTGSIFKQKVFVLLMSNRQVFSLKVKLYKHRVSHLWDILFHLMIMIGEYGLDEGRSDCRIFEYY